MSYAIVDVTDWATAGDETLGTKPKQWLRAPDEALWLWKAATWNRNAAGVVYQKGDDWAERLVCAVAAELSVPVARAELARRGALRGTVSRSVLVDESESLVHGNELFEEAALTGADPHDRVGYTV